MIEQVEIEVDLDGDVLGQIVKPHISRTEIARTDDKELP